MAKYMSVIGLEGRDPRRRSTRWVIVLGLVLITSPLWYEGGRVVLANWYGVMGTPYEVDTPTYSRLASAWASTKDAVQHQVSNQMSYGHWTPAMAVPIVFAFALFGSIFLKRSH